MSPTDEQSTVSLTRDGPTAALFDAMQREQLPVARCRACHHVTGPTARRCPCCTSADLALVVSAGVGRVESWTTTRDREGREIATAAIVELDEGAHVIAALLDASSRRPGARVRVRFRRSREGENYPVFVPEA